MIKLKQIVLVLTKQFDLKIKNNKKNNKEKKITNERRSTNYYNHCCKNQELAHKIK